MKPKLLISACLCGKNTKYNGRNNKLSRIEELKEQFQFVLVCPELLGGLGVPRDPSEIKGGFVFSNHGKDVTKEYILGANRTLEIVKKYDIKIALLKESSPSCGTHMIYNGNFDGSKIDGAGMTAKVLKEFGIQLYSENEVDALLKNHNL